MKSPLSLKHISKYGIFFFVFRNVDSEEVRLIHDLLIRARDNAHRLARPVKQVSDCIQIHFALSLVQILDFDEKNQIITLNVWKHYVTGERMSFYKE